MVQAMKIAVLGAGSWGTALAALLAKKGYEVKIWAFEPEIAENINKNHENSTFLEGILLPETLIASNRLEKCLENAELILSVVPSHALRSVMKKAAKCIPDDAIIVSCTKGLEVETGKLVSDILKESLPHVGADKITYLSGPSFAIEVAKDLPTLVVIAGTDPENRKLVQETFRTETFLTFTHEDVIGVELGGALKNIIAIAAGMSDGLGYGANSRAALITRGLYEMIKIGKALGANSFTFAGLSGMGDLILTCTSTNSRNYKLGYAIGQGKKLDDVLKGMKMVAEGLKTTKAIYNIIEKHEIVAPICKEMYNILYKGKTVKDAAHDLTNMELRSELNQILA